jgi:transcriptional regulator with XRE-family HTH domain
MIKNERQYRITKAQAEKFERALRELESKKERGNVHPLLEKAQADALRSQLGDLRSELHEYQSLRQGTVDAFELSSLDELPLTLIRARVALGLSQKDLAIRLGLKEQQIQRYEASEYSGASLSRISEIIQALGIQLHKEVVLPSSPTSIRWFLSRLGEVGLDRTFILNRLLPQTLKVQLLEGPAKGQDSESLVLQAAGIVGRIYNWPAEQVLGTETLSISPELLGAVRFKRPSRFDQTRLFAYTAYARYLASLLLNATPKVRPKTVPTDPETIRNAILASYGTITFEHVLRYVWSLGIPVLPLYDPGAFHGACWRFGGRSVVVLKQRDVSEAKWIIDLLHELRHLAENQEENDFAMVDADSVPGGSSATADDEEKDATWFAGQIALGGRAEELAQLCARLSNFDLRLMKRAVQRVAARENVRVDLLANYMAYRLSMEGQDWWGTAQNLQKRNLRPWQFARDVLLENIELNCLGNTDRELLTRALREAGPV